MGLKGFNESELVWLKANGYKKVTDGEYVNKIYQAGGVITRILKTDDLYVYIDENSYDVEGTTQTIEEEYETFEQLINNL